uniref:(northern house mosquito) hypothetical protein n=1 Tax=Culex pipiens TaxID=7175 RepID=A0A8D8FYP1_CULPI
MMSKTLFMNALLTLKEKVRSDISLKRKQSFPLSLVFFSLRVPSRHQDSEEGSKKSARRILEAISREKEKRISLFLSISLPIYLSLRELSKTRFTKTLPSQMQYSFE